jgi:deltex-like protein
MIDYHVSSGGHYLRRAAYLPDNEEGRQVLKLLQTAWDRRLCFAIGTSATTGKGNVLVWNIPHKTSLHGGVKLYGYPDPDYFRRVIGELKVFGVE